MVSWVLLLWLGCGGPASVPSDPAPDWRDQIARWHHPEPLPPLPFREGARDRTLAELQGRWTLVAFVFTRCGNAEACPLTMQRVAVLQDALGPEVQLVVFTLDPAHDTPERMRAYAEAHGVDPARVVLGTLPPGADPALLREGLPSLFNVFALGEGPTTSHPTRVTLLAPDGTEAAHWEAVEVTADRVRGAISAGDGR
jgi:protein SCO1/2